MISTADQLVSAAGKLLDEGGVSAVTLRAVAQLVNVSHNAPYRHFADRNALLAGVAERDLISLRDSFAEIRQRKKKPISALKAAIAVFISFGREHPARYRLLFSDPHIASSGGSLEARAMEPFVEFMALVGKCQDDRTLPPVDRTQLTALLYACLHGLVDLELGGRARRSKGLGSIEAISTLLLTLLRHDCNSPMLNCGTSPHVKGVNVQK